MFTSLQGSHTDRHHSRAWTVRLSPLSPHSYTLVHSTGTSHNEEKGQRTKGKSSLEETGPLKKKIPWKQNALNRLP